MMAYWIFLAVLLGFLVAFQPLINTQALNHLNVSGMILINSLIFLVTCVLYFFASQGNISTFVATSRNMKWYLLSGGFFGAIIVGLGAWLFPRLGATMTLMLVVFGQLATALMADHFGWLGLSKTPFNWSRLLGLALVGAGCFFARR